MRHKPRAPDAKVVLVPQRLLIVNADDFGFTPDVNDGIIDAHRNGILTATTLMATGPAFDHAVTLARENPTLDIGCHLVLSGAVPLPSGIPQLVAAVAGRRIGIYEELKAQIEKILRTGLAPTHLDTHKHTHLLPPVLRAVARLSREFNIPWVRRPLLRWMPPGFRGALAECRMTDHFAGFRLTGRLRTPQLIESIRNLRTGLTELMCHPGYCRQELRAAHTRLRESREEELRALISPEAKQALRESQVELTSYRALTAIPRKS